ncbi:MAG: hypothetical protein JXA54_10730 [Candidatus Heimdallarchaeota archaeon]|nr:hypothetical protein [Candidatus Heimdallarchaeota archaeon]
MDFQKFFQVVNSFADSPSETTHHRGEFYVQVAEEIIQCTINQDINSSSIIIKENDREWKPAEWISNRLARLPLLANRIISYIPDEENYIKVSGKLLDIIERSPKEEEVLVPYASDSIIDFGNNPIPGTTSILYLISDAGEGKTTTINSVAKYQAQKYKSRESNWLLLPISLGGRPFIRFDDIVIGTITNQLRFPFLYYDAIIELAKLNRIVLALDGFEEMFVEGPEGEAVSALGKLVQKMDSSGNIVVAARKAYFEFKSLKTQGKLFDSLARGNVSFSKLSLDKWGKNQFIEYCTKRNVPDVNLLYENILTALPAEHPLLTRAVLVKRLVDIIVESKDVEKVLERIKKKGNQYFKEFIDVIIEREAAEKWIDKNNTDVATPLISKSEHYTILSALAEEMFLSSTDALDSSIIDLISDMVSEELEKPTRCAIQIRERTKQHALIVNSYIQKNHFGFDHQEFKDFFLGYKIYELFKTYNVEALRNILKKAILPKLSAEIAVSFIFENKISSKKFLQTLFTISNQSLITSYSKENCGSLVIKYFALESPTIMTYIDGMSFPSNAFTSININNLSFTSCTFLPTNLEHSKLSDCEFNKCNFDRIEIDNTTTIVNILLSDCVIRSIFDSELEESYYDPILIKNTMKKYGFSFHEDTHQPIVIKDDEHFSLTKRAFKSFLRKNQIDENFFRTKLGINANNFFDNVLPILIRRGIFEEVKYRGSGLQRRFKINVQMSLYEDAVSASNGNFDTFVDRLAQY